MTVMTTASSVWPRKPETTGRAQQDQDQDVPELRDEGVPRRLAAERLQLVRAVDLEALRRLSARQALTSHIEPGQRVVDGQRVPARRLGAGGMGRRRCGGERGRRHHNPPARTDAATHQS